MTLSIDRRATLWGDRVAVIDHDADERTSYADLARRARRMAARLTTLGVGEGDVVGLVSRNRVEALAAVFAAHRLGAVLAPLSHRLTPATVEEPAERLDPAVVLHEAAQRDLVRGMPTDRTCSFAELDDVEETSHRVAARDPEAPLFYLTANGKADDPRPIVRVPTRQTEWNCITEAVAWGLGRDDVAPVVLPLSHADGLHRLTLPLLYVGGTVVLERAFDPADTLDTIREYGATCLFANPKEFRELAALDAFEDADLGGVERAVSSDALEEAVRDAFLVHGVSPGRSYGRAEAGPNLLYEPGEDANPASLGRPFPDVEVRVVDDDGEPVMQGEAGRLEASGPLTATGYLDGEPFDGWVPTGDFARQTEEGAYVLARRNDGE